MFIDKMDLSKTELKPSRVEPIVKSKKYEFEGNQIMGIDRNILLMGLILVISLGVSFYLFRELQTIKGEIINIIKNESPDEELIEKVELNSEAVKAIENKLDQLITALTARDRAMNEARRQSMAPQAAVQVRHDRQDHEDHHEVHHDRQEEHIEIPVMGGRSSADVIMM